MIMNQRRGKTHRAAAFDDRPGDMTLVTFLKEAVTQLRDSGYEDPAFYFEQVEEHLRNGGRLAGSPRDVARVLGL